MSVPPSIDLAAIFPPPSTLPVEVLIGEDCVSQNTFSLDSVQDADAPAVGDGDVPDGARLTFRWRIIRSLTTGEAPPVVVEVEEAVNDDTVGIFDARSSFEVSRETLGASFTGVIDDMVGKVHRLEVRVTDGEFAASPINTLNLADAVMGSSYYYWLFTLDDQPCQ